MYPLFWTQLWASLWHYRATVYSSLLESSWAWNAGQGTNQSTRRINCCSSTLPTTNLMNPDLWYERLVARSRVLWYSRLQMSFDNPLQWWDRVHGMHISETLLKSLLKQFSGFHVCNLLPTILNIQRNFYIRKHQQNAQFCCIWFYN